MFIRTKPFGASPSGPRQARIEQSPQWHDGQFTNPQPLWHPPVTTGLAVLLHGADLTTPDPPLDIAPTDTGVWATPPSSGLRVTWFGHSSTLMEIDGARVLIDPFWGAAAGPSTLIGPRPFYAPPAALDDLPPIDAVVISHDHFDHLDQATVTAMSKWTATVFLVPLGIGAHLERWGIPPDRIRELDWWQTTTIKDLELVATPARHSSGRDPLRSNQTLWSGWALVGPKHRVWYSGDSGYFPDLAEIGRRLGPFDITLVESGQYTPEFPDDHWGPELAVQANELVGGRLLIPVHWGLLTLALHTWTEPVERVREEARCRQQPYLIPVPGVPTEPSPSAVADQRQWWPDLPYRAAADASVDPTVDGNPTHRVDITPCVLGESARALKGSSSLGTASTFGNVEGLVCRTAARPALTWGSASGQGTPPGR
ncbi:MBL fold metallo-hydrolase [Modestobacter sp. SSW1-42]|uniref:MBL fold metallo-hydrolase n=1 Tax=Modestobacter sp. SSW1-42 TaxID=596372 RepID=UPI00398693CF